MPKHGYVLDIHVMMSDQSKLARLLATPYANLVSDTRVKHVYTKIDCCDTLINIQMHTTLAHEMPMCFLTRCIARTDILSCECLQHYRGMLQAFTLSDDFRRVYKCWPTFHEIYFCKLCPGVPTFHNNKAHELRCVLKHSYLRKPQSVDITQILHLSLLIPLTEKGNHTADA